VPPGTRHPAFGAPQEGGLIALSQQEKAMTKSRGEKGGAKKRWLDGDERAGGKTQPGGRTQTAPPRGAQGTAGRGGNRDFPSRRVDRGNPPVRRAQAWTRRRGAEAPMHRAFDSVS